MTIFARIEQVCGRLGARIQAKSLEIRPRFQSCRCQQNAAKLLAEIDKAMLKIKAHPTANPLVQNFENKSKWYRFRLVMKSFKVVYKILKKMLIFVGLLHKSQGNSAYKALRTANYKKHNKLPLKKVKNSFI